MNEQVVASETTLLSALKKFFGYDQFRGKQQDVIANILAGNDTFVIMPTGAGKSLCYQLPAVMMEGTALVISPLIALMKNQVDQLKAFGIEAGFLNSSMNRGDYEAVKQKVLSRQLKLLYVAPESLVKEEFIDFLKQAKVSFVAVDEAHCISEWGHDFRPEYRRIREMLQHIGNVPVIALTATATPKVRQDIMHNLHISEAQIYLTSFNRTNLYYEIRPKVTASRATTEIIKYIKQNPNKSGIVYCLSRRKVEEIAEILSVNGIKAVPYHAGLDSGTRSRHQDMFLNEDIHVVVATIAFGMGIDKPDVRFVIHYDVPKSIESYYQETGRAGRDGLEGNCILFYDFNDIVKLEKFMKDKPVSERESGKHLLYEMAAFSESGTCRRKMMLHYFGEFFDDSNCAKMCDNCRYPKERFQAREYVAMVLGLVNAVNQKFGMTHLVNILRGSNNQQIILYDHQSLPFFEQGKDLSDKEWKAIISQLITLDFLIKDIDDYGVIKLATNGTAFLAKPHDIELIKFTDFDKLMKNVEPVENFKTYDEVLFDLLKKQRKKIATQKRIPPYVIFQETSLEDMATKYPISMSEFQNITGVGRGKAQKFAASFINLIKEYVEENGIERTTEVVVKSAARKSMNKLFIIQHVDRRTPLDQIASLKGMDIDTLLEQVEQIVYSGTKLNINYYIEDQIDEDKEDEIFDYFMNAETDDLAAAENSLGIDYSREEIRLVRIKFMAEVGN
ncbi:DNA helicase RecQ [Pontibacter sp. G13]|uniref:DNA helicase RecQ n=1 Tax=Pontibacter sp. G13 TaxID=3074898 RepID=UPI0028898DF7|nr:DNA helicase RecQ [Pontibacter sp. G13]WNJ15967.1 DNA helicase RecQ [Pontibacter sp. G13]